MSQITTHILDTTRGCPASEVPIVLSQMTDDGWKQIAEGHTNHDGRIGKLLEVGRVLDSGCYRMHFDTQAYFKSNGDPVFYPFVDIVFQITGNGQHYHIPLLLAAYGYSTYRGS
ncbi:hydroxyisourate hydrolase [Hahella sp. CCB-MM4]|uniref:hydroxyisourate hydrolase n=1 Tax=Hahella sp. (strain CCB-MM4) TaxID=1926491 RepID=UPI000B9A3F32|nr:hydroxyisourate hydrolase [Hahella sp. CCB-MM4]OZG70137.1 hydroxyisourate hydrolase [Hahella sp. CCB-MM4]